MRYLVIIFQILFSNSLLCQSLKIDTINFYDKSRFYQKINYSNDKSIKFIEYVGVNSNLKKIDFYSPKNQIKKEQIWNDTLLREIALNYLEDGQIIKRYDLLHHQDLSTMMQVNVEYPQLARENEIEGIIEVALGYDSNCIPISYKILNKLGHGIDEEVISKMELILRLSKKYNTPFKKDCQATNQNFKFNFTLQQ